MTDHDPKKPRSGWHIIANVAHYLDVNGVVSSCASVNLESGDDPFAIRFDRHVHLGVVELCDLCRERMQAQRTERESAVVDVCSCAACRESSVARAHRESKP